MYIMYMIYLFSKYLSQVLVSLVFLKLQFKYLMKIGVFFGALLKALPSHGCLGMCPRYHGRLALTILVYKWSWKPPYKSMGFTEVIFHPYQSTYFTLLHYCFLCPPCRVSGGPFRYCLHRLSCLRRIFFQQRIWFFWRRKNLAGFLKPKKSGDGAISASSKHGGFTYVSNVSSLSLQKWSNLTSIYVFKWVETTN